MHLTCTNMPVEKLSKALKEVHVLNNMYFEFLFRRKKQEFKIFLLCEVTHRKASKLSHKWKAVLVVVWIWSSTFARSTVITLEFALRVILKLILIASLKIQSKWRRIIGRISNTSRRRSMLEVILWLHNFSMKLKNSFNSSKTVDRLESPVPSSQVQLTISMIFSLFSYRYHADHDIWWISSDDQFLQNSYSRENQR